ncbi:MAG TPA: alpha/beta hydrolase fold domain-containing protein [Gammaproteobacteria bacterium]|nr:alpha/beta hydrolase fold domain-containing protein [Gammaproteobacteria bacterium]
MSSHELNLQDATSTVLTAIIIGTGFAGIGMAVALRQAGITNFIILEKAHDVGGVWRDNSYPGAACDVPSHLYSFSFEPNPDWTRVFASQAEIYTYLRHCARKYALAPHIQFGAEVQQAQYNETDALWHVSLSDGSQLQASLLITATGQLSRPALPKLAGIETFQGHAFHSATWDHSYDLSGKRVAVVGTGASAIQFVPAIVDQVAQLSVFQRSPAYLKKRPDRAYTAREKTLFRSVPGAMKLHRASIYLRYEAQALAFTRFKGLMKWAVGRPFQKLLAKDVADAELRAKLTPDYPIGCKRILLSSEYLKTMGKSNVELVTEGIKRITVDGIETNDGVQHPVDAIIYGTGFAATEFLAPMRITGRNGIELNDAWQKGAQAYLGMSVPNFPNFFMLYGPNTNLGHNSIVYMLESQIAHVLRCYQAMQTTESTTIEVDASRYRAFNKKIQQRLANTVWHGCTSWYVDESGYNSTNWPGFTLSYRWLTRFSSLQAYRLTRVLPGAIGKAGGIRVAEPQDSLEKLSARLLRVFLRVCFQSLMGPPFAATTQRRVISIFSVLTPGVGAVTRREITVNTIPTQVITPKTIKADGVILYLHGGAFCLGNAYSHRSISTRLAVESGMPVWLPEYRLAPEHPYPAAQDDVLACYDVLRKDYAAEQIVIGGDSAGGALALALALTLRTRGDKRPAALLLISPVSDSSLRGLTLVSKHGEDPMLRRGWLEQALSWYKPPLDNSAQNPLKVDLSALPPMLVQVGEQELLLSDSTRLAEHANNCGVACRLEIHAARWHVFHLQAFSLGSARQAIRSLGVFAREQVTANTVKPNPNNTPAGNP